MSVEVVEGNLRRHASGLYVPEEMAREREVWTREDWRVLEKATALLQARGLELFLGCTDHRCKAQPVARIRRNDGGITLQCAHKAREVYKSL